MMGIKKPEISLNESEDKAYAQFTVEPLERGFGITIGNSLRRILLASLPGAAAVGIKISGVDHEFSTIKGVKEEVTEIILNIKEIRFKMKETDSYSKVKCYLTADKAGEVYARDIVTEAGVEILTPDKLICTLDEGGSIDMVIYVATGRGWVPADKNKGKNDPIGYIAIDSLFTPVVKANFQVEPTRVDKSIDYDKLTIDLTTDGTISAKEIISLAAKVLNDHIKLFVDLDETIKNAGDIFPVKVEDDAKKVLATLIEDMEMSVRAHNCLKRAGISTIGELIEKTEDELLRLPNFGRRTFDEIKATLEKLGLHLKSSED